MPSRAGVPRREFLKAALAIGGSSALSACVDREGTVEVPDGDPASLPERQFAWNAYLPTGRHGNIKLPNHQLLLFLNYRESGPPTSSDREEVEAALKTPERAYQWGTGNEAFSPETTKGLLFFVGYSRAYFDRFEDSLPRGVDFLDPDAVVEELDEEAGVDDYDAVLLLSSDEVQVLLSAEQALRGRFETLNGVDVEHALTDHFEVADRRTGFLGVGRPAEEFEDVPISENSPTAMGYRSGFKDNQATEDRVSVGVGPFANGSTALVSRIRFDLDSWYDLEESTRVHRMFSPGHTPEEVGEIGEHLGGQSRITQETVERTPEDAREHGSVGHTQKVAMARDDDFKPTILRRSEGVSTDLDVPSMNFSSLQRRIEDFLDVRHAMDGDECDAEVAEAHDGILDHIEVLTRGTYLVPPRSRRALPEADPD